jgi:hypothetical protein
LAVIESLKRGAQLLSITTGVNLNPNITLTYSSLVNTFSVGATVTDSNGSTAIIVTDNGSSSMTLKDVILATGHNALSGTITAGVSPGGSSAVVNTFSWGDQTIALSGGNTFIITDIVLTNASAVPVHVFDTEWWGGTARTGINYADYSGGSPSGSPLPLANANQYMSISNGEISKPSPAAGNSLSTCGPVIYFTVGTPEGTTLTCDMYIYGYVLN